MHDDLMNMSNIKFILFAHIKNYQKPIITYKWNIMIGTNKNCKYAY